MNNYTLDYWRKKDGITSSLYFGEREYQQLKGKIFTLLNNIITDLAGYVLSKNGEIIERG